MPRPLSTKAYISPYTECGLANLLGSIRLDNPNNEEKVYVAPRLPYTMRCKYIDPRAPWNQMDRILERFEKFEVSEKRGDVPERHAATATAGQPYTRQRPSTVEKILQAHGVDKQRITNKPPIRRSHDHRLDAGSDDFLLPPLSKYPSSNFISSWVLRAPTIKKRGPTFDQLLATLNRARDTLDSNTPAPDMANKDHLMPGIFNLPKGEELAKRCGTGKVTKTNHKNTKGIPYSKDKSARHAKFAKVKEASIVYNNRINIKRTIVPLQPCANVPAARPARFAPRPERQLGLAMPS